MVLTAAVGNIIRPQRFGENSARASVLISSAGKGPYRVCRLTPGRSLRRLRTLIKIRVQIRSTRLLGPTPPIKNTARKTPCG